MYLTNPLHRAAQQFPEKTAARFKNRQRTFIELFDRVSRLAGALTKLGAQSGDRIAILSLNSDRYLEYQMAVPWAGCVLNTCNTRWSAGEIAYSLIDSGSCILFVDDEFQELAHDIRSNAKCIRHLIYCDDRETPDGMLDYEELIRSNSPIPDRLRRGGDLAAIFYTGGSTGFPKGVMLSHTSICSSAMSLHAELGSIAGGTYLHSAPMFHLADMGIAMPHWFAANTHSIAQPSPAERVFDPAHTIATIERDRVTHTFMVPTMIEMLIDHPEIQKGPNLESLNTVVYGASSISEVSLERAMAALPGVRFMEAYGMTELSPIATIKPPFFLTAEGRKHGKLRSAGRASFHNEIRIVDEAGKEVPRGEVGEVVVRGPNVMLGYWNKQKETQEVVRDGWMHTGDGAWMDGDGFIFVVNRFKDMIISGGENVYSAEVENVLMQHPGVASCAVIGIPDAEWGEAVHAVIVSKTEHEPSLEDLIDHCRALIAGYKCPRSIQFIDALPLSGFGKVLKTELRKPFWDDAKQQSI